MKTEPKEFYDLIECWRAMPKAGGQAPLKTKFNPSKLRRLVPHLFLLERCSKKDIRVRIMGSELENSLDVDSPDETVFETLLAEDWRFYDRFMKMCGGAPCAGRFSRSVERHDGQTVKVDSLGVPLADEEGEPRYMLGVVVTQLGEDNPMVSANIREPEIFQSDHEFVDLGNGIPCDTDLPSTSLNEEPLRAN